MGRREFFRHAGAAAGLSLLDPRRLDARQDDTEKWRTFEITNFSYSIDVSEIGQP
jgi:hypothetical protein